MADAEYQRCPVCGLGATKAGTLTIYKCEECGQVIGHMGPSGCIASKGCTAEGRHGHHGTRSKVAIVKQAK